jgi:hypothetical protein
MSVNFLTTVTTCHQNACLLERFIGSVPKSLNYVITSDSGRYEFQGFAAMLARTDKYEWFSLMHDSATLLPDHEAKMAALIEQAGREGADFVWMGPGTCNLCLVHRDYVLAHGQTILDRTLGITKKEAVTLECSDFLARMARKPLQIPSGDSGYLDRAIFSDGVSRWRRQFASWGVEKLSRARKWEEIQDYKVYVAHCPRTCGERRAPLESALQMNDLAATWITSGDLIEDKLVLPAGAACSLPEYSLWLKHKEAFALGGPALILEDDAVLCPDFRIKFERVLADAATDCRIISLASATWPCTTRPRSSMSVWAQALNTTVAYYIDAATCRLLHEWQHRPEPIDHWIGYAIRQLEIKTAWARPPLVDNGSLTGVYACRLQNK